MPKGTYVVAVSGGVDSMVLLDLARGLPGRELIVAHINHGIRPDAADDEAFVRQISMSHNIIIETTRLDLGSAASEEAARTARYNFLRHIQRKYAATAIVTAHHRDDLIETAVINMVRGTGWRGLSSLRSREGLLRPLLHVTKHEVVEYARAHQLRWREDATNSDQKYLRNYVRHSLVPRMAKPDQEQLYQYIVRQNELTERIDYEAAQWARVKVQSSSSGVSIPRYDLIMMPSYVAHELLQVVLRHTTGKSVVRPLVGRALLFCKVAKAHTVFPVDGRWQLRALKDRVIVEQRPTVVS